MIDIEDKGVLITSSELGASSVRHRPRRAASARAPCGVRATPVRPMVVGRVLTSERSANGRAGEEPNDQDLRTGAPERSRSARGHRTDQQRAGNAERPPRGLPGRPSRVDSDGVGDRWLGPPLGVALLLICARIERERGGMHAEGADGRGANGRTTAEIETERRDHWGRDRGNGVFGRGRHRLRREGERGERSEVIPPPFLAFQAIRASRVQREARLSVAL